MTQISQRAERDQASGSLVARELELVSTHGARYLTLSVVMCWTWRLWYVLRRPIKSAPQIGRSLTPA